MSLVIALVDDDRNILTSVSIALQQEGFTTYVTPETANSAQRRDPLIAASLLTPLTTLTPGRYLRRWARRLRDFGFSREDSVILAYASFQYLRQNQSA